MFDTVGATVSDGCQPSAVLACQAACVVVPGAVQVSMTEVASGSMVSTSPVTAHAVLGTQPMVKETLAPEVSVGSDSRTGPTRTRGGAQPPTGRVAASARGFADGARDGTRDVLGAGVTRAGVARNDGVLGCDGSGVGAGGVGGVGVGGIGTTVATGTGAALNVGAG